MRKGQKLYDADGLRLPSETKLRPGRKRILTHGTAAGYSNGCRDGCPGDPRTGITCRAAHTLCKRAVNRRYLARKRASTA